MGISIPKQIFKDKRKNSIEIYAVILKSKAPDEHPLYQGCSFSGCFCFLSKGIRTRRENVEDIRKKTVLWTVFADVATSKARR